MSAKIHKEVYHMAPVCPMLGKRIQKLRKERKISQLQFSEMINTSPTFVSRLEHGTKRPSLETLVLIADALDVSIDSLLAESRTLSHNVHVNELFDLLKDCSTYERFVILQNAKAIKGILRDGEPIRQNSNRSVT